MCLIDVPLSAQPLTAFDGVLSPAATARLHEAIGAGRAAFAGRTLFNINSTAHGGGVAELLAALLPFARGAGVDARWLVVTGDEDFFRLTKRLHNRLHGSAGDGGQLNDAERDAYEATLTPAAAALVERLRPGDLVLLHDPQTAGLAPALRAAGIPVVWRCHIGIDTPGELARSAWRFLAPYVTAADVCVFSRPSYAWDVIAPDRRAFISPSIDPFSPKNQELDAVECAMILRDAGLVTGPPGDGRVRRRALIEHDVPLLPGERYILQVSRWDALKDPAGIVDGFARYVAPHCDAHLVYAGPTLDSVADDPEGVAVFDHARAVRRRFAADVRARIHLACLPMEDPDENALMVNALQRSAAIVVQKSIAEGFGLTVAEAMWKSRPVVASARGGICDQIEHGSSGVLLDDPRDGAAFGLALRRLLDDPDEARALGVAAHERVRDHFLSDRSLTDYLRLLAPLAAGTPAPAGP
jgi:trehalose synthase